MNGTAVSAEVVSVVSAPELLWLPASALNCYEGDTSLRSWLTEPGVLTKRIRAHCSGDFQMTLLGETVDECERVREIVLFGSGRPWVFAQTRIPLATLEANPWLMNLGDTPLGEAFEAQGLSARTKPEFARLMPDHPVMARALEQTKWAAQALWMRRSIYQTPGGAFLVQEVFSPAIGREV